MVKIKAIEIRVTIPHELAEFIETEMKYNLIDISNRILRECFLELKQDLAKARGANGKKDTARSI